MAVSNPINDVPFKEHKDFDITDAIMYRKNDVGRLLLRLTIGGLMLVHGINKMMFGTDQISAVLTRAGIPSFFTFGVFLGEVLGPILMIVGFKSRIGAFLIAMDMLIAVLLVHAAQLDEMSPGGGWMVELNMLYLMGAIVVLFLGSGKYSITKGAGPFD